MSVESFELPQELISALKAMIKQFSGVGSEANHSLNSDFIAELNKNQEVLMQFPDQKSQIDKIMA